MPDITMCQPKKCAIKERCYRHIATPSDWQSWNDFSVNLRFGKDGWECASWIKITLVKDKPGA